MAISTNKKISSTFNNSTLNKNKNEICPPALKF